MITMKQHVGELPNEVALDSLSQTSLRIDFSLDDCVEM